MSDCEINAEDVCVEDTLICETPKTYIFINLAFTVLMKPFSQRIFDISEEICISADYLVNQYVKCISVYSRQYELGDKRDAKVVAVDLEYDCSYLYFDEDGKCIDCLGMVELILEVIDNVKEKLAPYRCSRNTEVIISIIGMENLPELIYGVGFLLDNKLDLSLVEDDVIEEFILNEYTPPLLDLILDGWTITVTDIKILQLNLSLAISVSNEEDRIKLHQIVEKKVNRKTSSSNINDKELKRNRNNKKSNCREDKDTFAEGGSCSEISDNLGLNSVDSPLFMLHAEHNVLIQDDPEEPDIDGKIDIWKGYSRLLRYTLSPLCLIPYLLVSKALKKDPIKEFEDFIGYGKVEDDAWEILRAYLKGDKEEANRQWQTLGKDALELTHNVLDLVSFIPGVGALPSLVNALIYGIEYDVAYFKGDEETARDRQASCLIASAGAIPFFRIGRAIPKIGKMLKVTKYLDEIEDAQKVQKGLEASLKQSMDASSKLGNIGKIHGNVNIPEMLTQRQALKAEITEGIIKANKNRRKIKKLKELPEFKEYYKKYGNSFTNIRNATQNYFKQEEFLSFGQNVLFVRAGRSKVVKREVEEFVLWLSGLNTRNRDNNIGKNIKDSKIDIDSESERQTPQKQTLTNQSTEQIPRKQSYPKNASPARQKDISQASSKHNTLEPKPPIPKPRVPVPPVPNLEIESQNIEIE